MCLGIPGKIISIEQNPLGMTMGRVSFAGVIKDVCLAYLPDAQLGDYVVVHVGFAISTIDEKQAGTIFENLKLNQQLIDLETDSTESSSRTSDPDGTSSPS
jgi:hydrogenase expression/formation protein HypC